MAPTPRECDVTRTHWPRRLLLGAVAIALLAAATSAWLWSRALGDLETKLAAIRALGEPVTIAELMASAPPLAAEQDVAELWLKAGSDIETAQRAPNARRLPILGDAPAPPPPGQPWAEKELVREFLADNAAAMRRMHEAAGRGGQARFMGLITLVGPGTPTVNHNQLGSLRGCGRALLLEAKVHSHDGDAHAAADSLRAGLLLSRSLEAGPPAVTSLVRVALFSTAADELKQLLPVMEWTDEDLKRLASTLEELDFKPDVKRALIGERVFAIASFEHFTGGPPWKRLLGGVIYGADEVRFLEIMADCVAAADSPWPELLSFTDNLQTEVDRRTSPRWNKLTRIFLSPATTSMVNAFARAELTRRLTIIAIALERYRRREGAPAESLATLVPIYLAHMPEDPTTGEPFHYAASGSGYAVWSPTQRFAMSQDETPDRHTGAYPRCIFRWPPAAGASRNEKSDEQ